MGWGAILLVYMNPRVWYAVGVILVIAAGAFFYTWWTQGDLKTYVARIYSATPAAQAPEAARDPMSGTYSSHTTESIILTQTDGSSATYVLAQDVVVYDGLGAEPPKAGLADLRAGMVLILNLNTDSRVSAIYIFKK